MVSITLSVSEDKFRLLEEIASERHAQPADLVGAYLDYLVAGGTPLETADDVPSGVEIGRLVQGDKAWKWLEDEPDLYTLEDGEPI
jgi:hypothetical protein